MHWIAVLLVLGPGVVTVTLHLVFGFPMWLVAPIGFATWMCFLFWIGEYSWGSLARFAVGWLYLGTMIFVPEVLIESPSWKLVVTIGFLLPVLVFFAIHDRNHNRRHLPPE